MTHQYLTNIPLEEALARYLQELAASGLVCPSETIPTVQAAGRMTAEAIYARSSVPHYLACAMDGIAVIARQTFGASETTPVTLAPEAYVVVDTGDPLPDGCDAVIMVEEVISQDGQVRLHAPAAPWQHVRQIGEDFCAGDMLLPRWSILTPAALGALLAGSVPAVTVLRQPRICLVPTGDEIVPADQIPGPGEIPDFNSTIFASQLQAWGAAVSVTPIVADQPDRLRAVLETACRDCDLALVMAGSSAGRGDYSASVIASLGRVVQHGLAIRPGKPAILGLCGSVPVIGLPGYPVSGLIVLEEIVRPVLTCFFGLDIPERPHVEARLTRRILSSLKYQEYVRVRLGRVGEQLAASPLDRGAGLVTSYVKADGLLVIPQDSEGLEAGAAITVRLMRPLDRIVAALCVIGSHDPLLDECADLFRRQFGPTADISSTHAGSMGGIMALRRGEAHLAGIHLLDVASGRYNVDTVERYFPQGGVILVEGVFRRQGLLVQPGNPLAIRDLADIAARGLRYVNRQGGAGTRLLLDYLLQSAGIPAADLSGYTREEFTHTAVAAQIASGSADAGLGILAAARMFGLDFLAVAEEQYDFLILASAWETPAVQHFLAILRSENLRSRLDQLGGYRLVSPGRIIWPAAGALSGQGGQHA